MVVFFRYMSFRLWRWAHTVGGMLFFSSIVVHSITHVFLMMCMPLPYYTELSGHDGGAYYEVALHPLPPAPVVTLMRYKRVGFALLSRALCPCNLHIGLTIAGILGSAVANYYFYRLAAHYLAQPLRSTLVFSVSPYLFAAAHVGLPDTLSIAMVFAALFSALTRRYRAMTIAITLALLFKEVAIVAIFALACIFWYREGVVRLLRWFTPAALPVIAVIGVYAIWWHHPLWYIEESRMATTVAPVTLVRLITAPNSWLIVRVGATINMLLLTLLVYGVWRLVQIDVTLVVFVVIGVLPLLFLDERQYGSDFDMARQYMVAAPVLLAFAAPINRLPRWVFTAMLGASLCYALYYALSIGRFFVTYHDVVWHVVSL